MTPFAGLVAAQEQMRKCLLGIEQRAEQLAADRAPRRG
jgi:hypothetical protein